MFENNWILLRGTHLYYTLVYPLVVNLLTLARGSYECPLTRMTSWLD